VVTDGAGHPIVDALVRPTCKVSGLQARTGSTGAFSGGSVGCFQRDCEIEISREGFVTRRVPVSGICDHEFTVWQCRSGCSQITAKFMLESQSSN
jgi:hypothetical protein